MEPANQTIKSGEQVSLPETREQLFGNIRALQLPRELEDFLWAAIIHVLDRQERNWRTSKEEALKALTAGFGRRIEGLRRELSAKDATISSINRYFEDLVADLTDKVHRDPKTRLINFRRFMEQLEAFLYLEQRSAWCAVGLVDITSFKWYNDALGHAVGDRIIERVARLLREHVQLDGLIVPTPPEQRREDRRGVFGEEVPDERRQEDRRELHARFGGDEFCFLIPDLESSQAARMIAESFRAAVDSFDWAQEDERLAEKPVRVDVGVVCLLLGPSSDRKNVARRLANELINRADALMYDAKGENAQSIYMVRVRIKDGQLVELGKDERVG